MGDYVRYRNRLNGHEGIVKRSDFDKARRKTNAIYIIEVVKDKKGTPVKKVKEPEAVQEAKELKEAKAKEKTKEKEKDKKTE